MRFRDLRPLLDAAYEMNTSEGELVSALAGGAAAWLENGCPLAAVSYERVVSGRVAVRQLGSRHFSQPLLHRFSDALVSLEPKYVDRYLGMRSATSSENGRDLPRPVQDFLAACRQPDLLTINGYDAAGLGIFIACVLPTRTHLKPSERNAMNWVAMHLVSALRLRDAPSALTEVNDAARLAAVGDENEEPGLGARVTRSLEALKTLRRTGDSNDLRHLTPRVLASWSVVGRFLERGEDHVVLRRNPAPAPGPRALTERERQVVALVEVGHSMKEVAYELGIAYATVRVLKARAMTKLRTCLQTKP